MQHAHERLPSVCTIIDHDYGAALKWYAVLRECRATHDLAGARYDLDNASYHVTKATLDLLTEHEDHIFVVWLPKYSPKLNAIEGLWGYLKESALNNYFFGDVESLEKAIVGAFDELNRHPDTALSLAYNHSQNLRRTA